MPCAIAELGGEHSSSGTDTQIMTSTVNETVDPTKLATGGGELFVGFYNGATSGKGFTSMKFDLFIDGADVIDKTFTSASDAMTYFTDHPIDLGALESGAGGTLTFSATMVVTTDAANSGFYGELILGDPPVAKAPTVAKAPAANAGRLVDAMSMLGAGGGGLEGSSVSARALSHPMLAIGHAAMA